MSVARSAELESVLAAIRACRHCIEAPHGKPLPHEPRPVLRASRHGAACRVQPGAGHQGPCLGHAVHRPLRRPLARLDGGHAARILRRGARRHRADGVLLSRAGCERRRSAAAARMRGAAGIGELFAALPQLELVLAVGSYAQAWHLGEAAGEACKRPCSPGGSISNARQRPRVLPLPHPSWRNNGWLTRQSLVRGGAVAGAAPRGAGARCKNRLLRARGKIIY